LAGGLFGRAYCARCLADIGAWNDEIRRRKRMSAERKRAYYRALRDAPEGIVYTAVTYMGECPAGDGRLNVTYAVVKRQGQWWHAGCDPEPDPSRKECWCGPSETGEHDRCYRIRYAFLWLLRGLRESFQKQEIPKGFRR
ncbi:MAG TPA: hypothetical protein VIB47_07155, partial [Dehalococcoidia bacterium]